MGGIAKKQRSSTGPPPERLYFYTPELLSRISFFSPPSCSLYRARDETRLRAYLDLDLRWSRNDAGKSYLAGLVAKRFSKSASFCGWTLGNLSTPVILRPQCK